MGVPSKKQSRTRTVTWDAHYSERAGRDYYYNPKTGVVTWILPDDDHPEGTALCSEVVVSDVGNADVIVGEPAPVVAETKPVPRQKRVLSYNATIMILLVLSVGLNLILWWNQTSIVASETPHLEVMQNNSVFFDSNDRLMEGEESYPDSRRDLKTEQSAVDVDAGENHGNIDQEVRGADSPQVIHHQDSDGTYQETPADNKEREEIEPDIQPATIPIAKESEVTDQQAASLGEEVHTGVSDEKSRGAKLDDDKPPERQRPKGCMIPLAYVVSGKCRRLARESPLFDAQQFVQDMML